MTVDHRNYSDEDRAERFERVRICLRFNFAHRTAAFLGRVMLVLFLLTTFCVDNTDDLFGGCRCMRMNNAGTLLRGNRSEVYLFEARLERQ